MTKAEVPKETRMPILEGFLLWDIKKILKESRSFTDFTKQLEFNMVIFFEVLWAWVLFSFASITNYHKLSGLTQSRFIIITSGGQSPKWAKVSAGLLPYRGPMEELFPCLFQLLEAACFSCSWSLSPCSKHITQPLFLLSHLFLFVTPLINTLCSRGAHLDNPG